MGRTYQLNATVLPEGAPQDVIYEVTMGGDNFDISETGLITPKAATSSLCMIQVKSKEDPSKLAVFMFKIKEAPDMGKLLENISLSYAKTSADWKVMDMGAYASAFPTGTGLSKTVRQSYVDTVIDHLENGSIKGDTDYDKVILALSAIGVDPSKLYAADGKTQFDAFALLNGVSHSTSAWSAPYTLAALNLPGASGLETDADHLVDALIAAQQEDGSWNEFGTIDTTANVIAGLSFYAGEAKVDAAIEKGVAYLASQMKSGGVYDGGDGANANSTEMVIIGLCAAGVNPDTDERFIQDGVSVLDGLLSYAVEGNTGFGYTDNKSVNDYATEQGFRALIAASQVMKTGKAYNIYDFRDNKVEPGYATWADNCMVNFKTVPADAAVVVKQGDHTISFAQDHDGYYDLAAGDYTYTVSRDGYKTKTGTFTVTEEQAQTHDRQTISVSLTSSSSSGGGSSKDIRVTVKVMVPPEDTTKAYTYKNDSSAYSNLVTKNQTVTVTSGTSVRDAMVQALDDNSIDYVEESNGYFSSINGLAEFERGKNSGWMYLVNGSLPDVTAQNYELTRNSTVTWFYTDDYTKDYGGLDNGGSSGGGSSNAPETAVDKAEKLIDAIGSVTKDSGAKIKAARAAYDALTAAQKKLVENYAKLTAAETAYAALTGGKTDFTDVPAGYWAEDGIRYVYDKGLMQGTTASAFSPEQTTTRGMIAAILYRLENSPAVTGGKSFSDVTDGMYCADAVRWAQSCGIVNGYSDGRFAPNASITREQLAAILYRYAAYKNQDVAKKADLSAFTDAGSVSAYAKEALAWANAAGLVNGTVSGTLNPQGGATRAQAAMILMRWLEKTAG